MTPVENVKIVGVVSETNIYLLIDMFQMCVVMLTITYVLSVILDPR